MSCIKEYENLILNSVNQIVQKVSSKIDTYVSEYKMEYTGKSFQSFNFPEGSLEVKSISDGKLKKFFVLFKPKNGDIEHFEFSKNIKITFDSQGDKSIRFPDSLDKFKENERGITVNVSLKNKSPFDISSGSSPADAVSTQTPAIVDTTLASTTDISTIQSEYQTVSANKTENYKNIETNINGKVTDFFNELSNQQTKIVDDLNAYLNGFQMKSKTISENVDSIIDNYYNEVMSLIVNAPDKAKNQITSNYNQTKKQIKTDWDNTITECNASVKSLNNQLNNKFSLLAANLDELKTYLQSNMENYNQDYEEYSSEQQEYVITTTSQGSS